MPGVRWAVAGPDTVSAVDAGGWATLVGDVLAAAAIVVAVVTLRHAEATAKQARNDLREDRRIDFLQSTLLDIAVGYQQWARGDASASTLAARVRVLPPNMLPLMRAALGLPVTLAQRRQFEALAAKHDVGVDEDELLQPFARNFHQELHAEIDEALDRLTEQRP
jgi:hypothetical protein